VAISSPGVGSGLDINSIVTQLAAVEKQPLVTLQKNASKLQTQLSSFGMVKSQLATLQDAAQNLLATDTWGAKTFTSSSSAAVTGTAGVNASANSFKIRVAQLASVEIYRTKSEFSIQRITGTNGQIRERTVNELGGSTGQITITSNGVSTPIAVEGTDTLSTIASKINNIANVTNVKAFVVTGDDGQIMQLSGTKTGSGNTFSVTETMNTLRPIASTDPINYVEKSEETDGGTPKTIYQTSTSFPIQKITDSNGQLRERTVNELGGGTGQITITSNGVSTPIAVEGTDTLSVIVGKINEVTSDTGVVASVTDRSDGQFLKLSKLDVTDSDFSVTETMNTQRPISSTNTNAITYVEKIQEASNAEVYINGNDTDTSPPYSGTKVTSSNNTVADAVPGMTLNLLTKTTSNVQITVGTDTETIKTKIQGFQDAYNTLVGNLQDLTKYDAATKKAGALQADGTAVGLLSLLRSMISSTGPKATYDYAIESQRITRLSDVGLQVQQNGLLATNATKLTNSLNNLDNLKIFFYKSATTVIDPDTGKEKVVATDESERDGAETNENGLARRFRDFARTANGIQGTVSLKNVAIQSAINRNSDDQDKLNTKIEAYQKRLYKQYSALDSKMGSLNGLSSFVSSQVAQWNKK
jgi:flagellar hook-associated protein 2